MAPWIAAKELTNVEVHPKRSHQHEFHADRLRKLLGFSDERVSGELLITIVTHDENELVIDEGTYTLYDSREAVPGRREWRLYYTSRAVGENACAGDLLVIYRHSDSRNLRALIIRPGTQVEKAVRAALQVGDHSVITRFTGVPSTIPSLAEAQQLLDLPDLKPTTHTLVPSELELYKTAVRRRKVPGGREMAEGARRIVEAASGSDVDADRYLELALQVESELFFAIEKEIGNAELKEIVEAGGDFTEVMDFALSKSQARRSRRGLSLQNHVETLLNKYGVKNTPQCETEPGETPDFIIPSCSAYHDAGFPDDQLRMVGCKSRIRDRWRQYLNEAARISIKHHVSVDEDLSSEVLRAMHAHGLRTCMPAGIAERSYSNRDVRELIMSIMDLISELRSVSVGRS